MTSVPYPTFSQCTSRQAMMAVGRCRIQPAVDDSTFQTIVVKCKEQGADDPSTNDEAKKLHKKLMKQAVSMASHYLRCELDLDVSVIDVEILLPRNTDVTESCGCLTTCFLDAGCSKVVLVLDSEIDSALQASRLPRERVMVHIPTFESIPLVSVFDQVRDAASSVSVYVSHDEKENTDDLVAVLQEKLLIVLGSSKQGESLDVVAQFQPPSNITTQQLADMVTKLSQSTLSTTTQTTVSLIDPSTEQLGHCYAACLNTDRPDGLFTTVVCTRSGVALGLVYSSIASIVAALECGRGVYYSRSRQNLWRKGDTSGHYQTLHRIDVDCDGDALRFTVTQQTSTTENGAAFCHLNTLTCWGQPCGLSHLEITLRERLLSAPDGSYTKRLLDDPQLLRDKLVEEAQELSEAVSKEHVAEELADVWYFAAVAAVKAGATLDDAVAELDRRRHKVTRRPGDSKAYRIAAGQAILDQKRLQEQQEQQK